MKPNFPPRWVRLLICPAVFFALWAETVHSKERSIGLIELSDLIKIHQPFKQADPSEILDSFQAKISFEIGEEPAIFVIPGFKAYGCNKCHKGKVLARKTTNRIQAIIRTLRKEVSFVGRIPLKQFILQPYADALLNTASQSNHQN